MYVTGSLCNTAVQAQRAERIRLLDETSGRRPDDPWAVRPAFLGRRESEAMRLFFVVGWLLTFWVVDVDCRLITRRVTGDGMCASGDSV